VVVHLDLADARCQSRSPK